MSRALLTLIALVVTLSTAVAQIQVPPERTGRLYISGFGSNNVGEYHPDGTLIRSITAPNMTQPRGVAVDADGNLIVVCQGSQRILVLDLEGNVLQTVTHPLLTSGTGISRSPQGEWFVGNFNPGRIVVFDAAWNFQREITSPGLSGVNCVSFDSNGTGAFALTSATLNLMVRFDAAENAIGTVSHPNITSPMSIADDFQGNHYVSGGSSGVVVKFDPVWNPLQVIGQGVLSGPQGIAVDELGRLTISNFFANTVHRYSTAGVLMDSWPLVGVTTGRNIAWQTEDFVLARRGNVRGALGERRAILSANASTGDNYGRLSFTQSQPLTISLDALPQGPAPSNVLLYGSLGEPTASDTEVLIADLGLFSFATPLTGAQPFTLINTFGAEAILGTPQLPGATAPGTVISLPAGLGVALTLTIQAIVEDSGATANPTLPLSVSNALIITWM